MPLFANTRVPAWGDGLTYAGNDQRLTVSALSSGMGGANNPLATSSGVRPGAGNPMQVNVAGGLSVTVNTGYAVIQGSAAANAGDYIVTNDSVLTLTCAAADTVNPRVDLVCVTVNDVGTSSSYARVQIVTGTPAGSPSAPALPSNSIALATITVAANATTLTGGNIIDQRTWYSTIGGPKLAANSTAYPSVGEPGWVYDIQLDRWKQFTGSAIEAPKVAAFAPVSAGPNSVTAGSSTPVTIVSQTVTVDGKTNVRASLYWAYFLTSATSPGYGCTLAATRSGADFGSIVKYAQIANGPIDGGSWEVIDYLPAAGVYTYLFSVANQGAGNFAPHNAYGVWEAQPL